MCLSSWRHCCGEWKLWIRPLLILVYSLFALIVVPLLIVYSVREGFTRKEQLIGVGGLFVLAAVPISIWHIIQHMIHYTKAILQKHIIRILWMVPIYALNAWLSLLFPTTSIYLDSLRECYEAYVIYNFMMYLLNYLNLSMDLEQTLEHKPQINHIFPLCCMRPWEMGREFIHNCKHGILQYTVVRPITTFISVICDLFGVYGAGSFKSDVAFPYIIVINNLSQFSAMYCLVLFYQANKADLKPMKPIPKFLCIKAVVFFSFFQQVTINFLVYYGYIKDIFGSEGSEDFETLASNLQNFLICIEMFVAAVAHIYSFPHEPFHINVPEFSTNVTWYDAVLAMCDVTDIRDDVSEHIGVLGSSLSRRLRGRTSYQVPRGGSNSESQYLIAPSSKLQQNYQSEISTSNENFVANMQPTSSNRYGAVEKLTIPANGNKQAVKGSNSAINIAKKEERDNIVPNYGAPATTHYFLQQSRSSSLSSARNNTTTNTSSSKSDSNSTSVCLQDAAKEGAINTTGSLKMKKSDSTASDWLSTPTDEMMGIDVKGIEKDSILNFKNPKA